MIAKEIELVNEDFIKRKDTYNIALGGKGGIINEAHNKKLSKIGIKAFKDKLLDEDYRINFINKCRESKIGKLNPAYGKNYNGFKGRKHTKKSIKKIKESLVGKQSGSNNSQFGKTWITNGKDNMKIYRGSEIPEGWILGRKMK
jgi:hypothetical protein